MHDKPLDEQMELPKALQPETSNVQSTDQQKENMHFRLSCLDYSLKLEREEPAKKVIETATAFYNFVKGRDNQNEAKIPEDTNMEKLKTCAVYQEPMMQFFSYQHLPPHLQKISENFWNLACYVVNELPRNPERTIALRKLLEAKDNAIRCSIYK